MRHLQLRLNFDSCRVTAKIAFILLFSVGVFADDLNQNEGDGLVEVHFRRDPNADYGTRRTKLSYRIGASYENFSPSNYTNNTTGATYNSIYGNSNLPIYAGFLGAQWNTGIGSLSIDATYGLGTMQSTSGSSQTLGISKYGVVVGYSLDHVWSDPWAIPFVSLHVLELGYNESETANINTGTTSITLAYSGGVSIPLNRFDPTTAKDGFMDFGIKNAFLDVFAIEYNTSSSSTDPDLATSVNWGAGFHVEF